jgi:monovalent cation/hydrogen antiporter
LVLTIVVSVLMGLIVAAIAALAWRLLQDETLQATISVVVPFLAYLPAYYLGESGVLATVTTGIAVTRFGPLVLQPRAREMLTGFWVTVVFLLNAFIFAEVGIRFHEIVSRLHEYSAWQLLAWGGAIALVCIVVRLLWTFAQGLLPITNEPEHVSGKADWSHVALLGWTGMRGGISLAAALAIPLETIAGPFPDRDLVIFITFVVLLATLVGQGGTLPFLIRWLHIKDDGAAAREERLALMAAARAGLDRLDELARQGKYSEGVCELHRRRLEARYAEFTSPRDVRAARKTAEYRELQHIIVGTQRQKLIELRAKGKIDNTVFRRLQRVLDLQDLEVQLVETAGHSDIEED